MIYDKIQEEEAKLKRQANRSTSVNRKLRTNGKDVVTRLYNYKNLCDVKKKEQEKQYYKEVNCTII